MNKSKEVAIQEPPLDKSRSNDKIALKSRCIVNILERISRVTGEDIKVSEEQKDKISAVNAIADRIGSKLIEIGKPVDLGEFDYSSMDTTELQACLSTWLSFSTRFNNILKAKLRLPSNFILATYFTDGTKLLGRLKKYDSSDREVKFQGYINEGFYMEF
jgi:hypothetical protein